MKRKNEIEPLTIKQERFAYEYVINGGNASAAYRSAYDADNMKPETINKRASELLLDGKITGRIEHIRAKARERNDIKLDRVIQEIAATAFLDPIEVFNDDWTPKTLSEIEEQARRAIVGIKKRVVAGEVIEETIEVKLADKLAALDKLMKHLGGYERDNAQRITSIVVRVES